MALPPLLTPAEFAEGTGGQVSEDDPRLPRLLDAVSAAIRSYCGWHVTPVLTEEMVLDGSGGRVLLVPSLRIVSIEGAAVRGVDIDVSGLEWSPRGMMKRSGCWPDRYRSVKLVVKHGFEAAADLVQVAQQVAANIISSPMGTRQQTAGPYSISFSTTGPGISGGMSLLERDLATLDRYRLPSVA